MCVCVCIEEGDEGDRETEKDRQTENGGYLIKEICSSIQEKDAVCSLVVVE